jgi:hypothetical protein
MHPLRSFLLNLIDPWILLAGILFGLTLSIRLFAPLAAGIVLIYLFWKRGRRAISPSIAYCGLALVATYLTWPYLWGAPVQRIEKSWEVMNAFSMQGSWSDLPKLLGTQYTEPAILLAVVGMLIVSAEFIRGKRYGLFILFLCWTILPVGILILRRSHLYDNFRQVLFVIPPFFILAGLTIEKLNKFLRHPAWIGFFILLASLPGIVADVKLHPYQYIYYNKFVTVVDAEIRLNRDYWATSLKETAQYLNSVAPANSSILVCGPIYSITPYLRSDLKTTSNCNDGEEFEVASRYVVLTRAKNFQMAHTPPLEVVYTVVRENSILAVVKSVATNLK